MLNRIEFVPAPRVRTENSGHLLDLLIFLVLWYAVRYAMHIVSYGASVSLLAPTQDALHTQIAYLVRSLAGLLFCIWYFKRFCRRRNIGFSERLNLTQPVNIASPAFLAYLCIFLFVFPLPNLAYYMVATRASHFIAPHVALSSYILTGIRVIILSPFVEELIWRGFAYPIFKARFGLTTGIILTALLFSAPHFPAFWQYPSLWVLTAFGYMFLVGASLTVVLEREGNLKWCILLHALLNLSLFLLDIVFKELLYAAP